MKSSGMSKAKGPTGNETYWQEIGDYRFVLVVDGHQCAKVSPGHNRGVILGGQKVPAHKFVAPDSVVIYDMAEKKLGLPRVKEFRDRFGMRTFLNWRGIAERRAAYLSENCPPAKAPERHAEFAMDMLNLCAVDGGGLNNKGSDARVAIAAALNVFKSDARSQPKEMRQHLEAAKQCLHNTIDTDESTPYYATALHACDKAIASLDHNNDLVETLSVSSSGGSHEIEPYSAALPIDSSSQLSGDDAYKLSPGDSGDRLFLSRASRSSERADENGRDPNDFERGL